MSATVVSLLGFLAVVIVGVYRLQTEEAKPNDPEPDEANRDDEGYY